MPRGTSRPAIFSFIAGTRFFGKIAGGNQAYTLWNVQGLTALTWGVNSNLEFTLAPMVYQDTNNDLGNALDGQANVPDDLWFSMKVASFGGLESPWLFGGLVSLRIPTAESHNVIFEPYSAGALEFTLMGLVSYYSNTTFVDEGWSFHGNLGYLNHNDVGKEISPIANAANAQRHERRDPRERGIPLSGRQLRLLGRDQRTGLLDPSARAGLQP